MSPIRMSRLESAIRVVLAFTEAFNRNGVTGMVKLLSDDCVFETHAPSPDGTVYLGKKLITRFLQNFFDKSFHAHIETKKIFGLGIRCITYWKYEWADIEGGRKHIRGVDLFQVKTALSVKNYPISRKKMESDSRIFIYFTGFIPGIKSSEEFNNLTSLNPLTTSTNRI